MHVRFPTAPNSYIYLALRKTDSPSFQKMPSEVKPAKHELGVSESLLNVSYLGGVVGRAGLALKPFGSVPFSPFWVSVEGLLIQQVE